MSFRRALNWMAAAAMGLSGAAGAQAGSAYHVSITTGGSCSASGTVTVTLTLDDAPAMSDAVGAQLYLTVDSRLTVSSHATDNALQEVNWLVSGNDIDFAMGTTTPSQRIGDDAVLGTITFSYSGTICNTANLVAFRSHTPPTRLTDTSAQPIIPLTSNLGAVTLGDGSAPVINGGSALPSLSQDADTGVCTWTGMIPAPSVTDACSFTLTATLDGNPFTYTSDAALSVGTHTVVWTATDGCGQTRNASQTVTVFDTQAPSITCPSNATFPTDSNLCSYAGSIVAPTFGDNCPSPTLQGKIGSTVIAAGPYTFPKGTTTIDWTVTDASSNQATCSQNVTVEDHQNPTFDTCPSGFTTNADAGACTYVYPIVLPTFHDNCPGATLAGTLDGSGFNLGDASKTLAVGTHTFVYTATDTSSNTATCTQVITVNNMNSVVATVALAGVDNTPMTRGVQFALYSCGSSPVSPPCQLIPFLTGSGQATFDVPCGQTWNGITATDPKHTLRRSAALTISGRVYTCSFTNAKSLEGGNDNNDEYIDILDFGGYIGRLNSSPGANSTCTGPLHPDFSGDGTVFTEDFTFIQDHFLHTREADPCSGAIVGSGPTSDIAVADLVAQGMREFAMADFNLDGRLNAADITWVAQNGLPACIADFNDDQAVTAQDIFAFLNAWFMNHPRADVSGNLATDVQDIFSFLGTWFQGC